MAQKRAGRRTRERAAASTRRATNRSYRSSSARWSRGNDV